MRLESAVANYLLQLEADGRSAHTIGQYRRHLGLLGRWLGSRARDLRRITPEDLARFLTSTEAQVRPDGQAKKPTSMNALRTSLRAFFAHLRRAGVLELDPARLIRRALCAPPPPRALSPKEDRRLARALSHGRGRAASRDRVLFRLMRETGIRLGSAVALDVEDLDLERGEVALRHVKGGREDLVFLSRALARELRRYRGARTTGPLFIGHGGRRIGARHGRRRLAAWARKAAIRPISPHALRHTMATRLYERTGDLLLVRAALGHRSLSSTMVYARVPKRRLRNMTSVTGPGWRTRFRSGERPWGGHHSPSHLQERRYSDVSGGESKAVSGRVVECLEAAACVSPRPPGLASCVGQHRPPLANTAASAPASPLYRCRRRTASSSRSGPHSSRPGPGSRPRRHGRCERGPSGWGWTAT